MGELKKLETAMTKFAEVVHEFREECEKFVDVMIEWNKLRKEVVNRGTNAGTNESKPD